MSLDCEFRESEVLAEPNLFACFHKVRVAKPALRPSSALPTSSSRQQQETSREIIDAERPQAADCATHGKAASSPPDSGQAVGMDANNRLVANVAGPTCIPTSTGHDQAGEAAVSAPDPLTARAAAVPQSAGAADASQEENSPHLRLADASASHDAEGGNDTGIHDGIPQ